MSYEGEVRGGLIVLDPPVQLPEGTRVQVILGASDKSETASAPTLYERLRQFDGVIKDLPADFASEHDHYIHGTPKRNG